MERRSEFFDSNISVSYILACMITASMHLKSDAPFVDMPFLFFLPFHDLDSIDPCGDVGGVADNTGSTFIPLAMAPEVWPRFRQNG